MKRFRFESDRMKKKIYISKVYFFGPKKIKTFSSDEDEKAIKFLKDTAAKNNRPSRVSMLDGQGNIRRQWEYAPHPNPYSHKTKHRKLKYVIQMLFRTKY